MILNFIIKIIHTNKKYLQIIQVLCFVNTNINNGVPPTNWMNSIKIPNKYFNFKSIKKKNMEFIKTNL